MPIRATGPNGAATRPVWKINPVPEGLASGPVDSATFAVLRHCEALPGDVETVLAPSLGIGTYAGQRPVGPERLHAATGLSVERTRWLLHEAAVLARYVGPPKSLTSALGLVEAAGVIGLPALVATWLEQGLTETALHPQAAAKIAGMFGLAAPFSVLRGAHGQWRTPLVVSPRLHDTVPQAAVTIRRHLRPNHVLAVDEIVEDVPGLTADQARRLCEACWSLTPDGASVVEWRPHGFDGGISRTMLAAGQPIEATVVHEGLRRWARDAQDRNYDWTARELDRYLVASPLYASHSGGTYAVVGGWSTLTAGDKRVLAAVDAVGEPASRQGLVAALTSAGYGDGAAKHLIDVSPAIAAVSRGMYRRPGTW